MKSNKGVTLIALVITIIVLLILAGVSISLVVGDSGVFTRGRDATTKTQIAGLEEAVNRAVASAQGEYTGTTDFTSKRKTFFEWLTANTDKLKENGYQISLTSSSDELKGFIYEGKEPKSNAKGLNFKITDGKDVAAEDNTNNRLKFEITFINEDNVAVKSN